jgi:hypothetical protein
MLHHEPAAAHRRTLIVEEIAVVAVVDALSRAAIDLEADLGDAFPAPAELQQFQVLLTDGDDVGRNGVRDLHGIPLRLLRGSIRSDQGARTGWIRSASPVSERAPGPATRTTRNQR